MKGLTAVHLVLLLVATDLRSTTAQGCDPSASRTDCGYVGITEKECEAKSCCWSPANNKPWCFARNSPAPKGTCQPDLPRNDCGYYGITKDICNGRGCCWAPKEGDLYCFYPTSHNQYIVKSVTETTLGVTLTIVCNGTENSTPYGTDISPLQVVVEAQTNERVHIKILDPNNKRWEVPTYISPAPSPPSSRPSSPLYKVIVPSAQEPFSFQVIRLSDGSTLFNTSYYGVLRFVDQYLSIGSSLPKDYFLYGLGEHELESFRLNNSQTLTFFSNDMPTPIGPNLYGSHPFYLEIRPPSSSSSSSSSFSHGVYLRNSNGMDISLFPTSINYRVIGGVLDFYFFLGPQPEGVIQQYQEVIGRPHMPPYWGLGFHNCRYGYPNVETLVAVVANYSSAKIPLETMWTDIDYMDQKKDFTLDPVNFPANKMNQFVNQLHSNGQYYVVIVDPGILNEKGYSPYDEGMTSKSFIMDKNGNVFIGEVWPGTTAFPDFLKNSTLEYWQNQISTFLKLLPVDGLWIDMNEISNFCNGACTTMDTAPIPYHPGIKRKSNGMKIKPVGFNPNTPPYVINNRGSRAVLNVKTIDMDTTHLDGTVLEYNAHNLYGLSEARATNMALEKLKGKRSFIISRSTFPGSGSHAGHWTGDNHSSAVYLRMSVYGMLNHQMFGIPLVGADICGFLEDTTAELCSRWIELGSFYPFSRVHNAKGTIPQELYRWPEVAAISRKVLSVRYSILPYYYTLFYKVHASSPAATVVRPLFFEFYNDSLTYTIDTQFMVGSGLMVSPVTELGVTSKTVYFPQGKWYDWYSHDIVTATGGTTQTLSTPLDHIQVHLRGGYIIPMQQPSMTTTASRKNPFSLLVSLNDAGSAEGDMYLDDGESLTMSSFTFVTFSSAKNTLTSQVSGSGYASALPPLSALTILGVKGAPSKATINGQAIPTVTFNSTQGSLGLSGFQTSLATPITVVWE